MFTTRQPRTMTTAKGKSVTTVLTDAEALAALQGATSRFAQELCQKARGRYGLSPDQTVWLHVLALEAQGAAGPVTPDQPMIPLADDMSGAVALFATAAQHLKFPKVRLLAGGQPVVLSLYGGKSQYAGQIRVQDDGDYESRRWFGRVDPAGRFHPGRDVPEEVIAILIAFAARPAETAAAHGRLTGHCCFCGLKLTDERSTDVGYGPICAGHFGLPWGDAHVAAPTPAQDAALGAVRAAIPGYQPAPKAPKAPGQALHRQAKAALRAWADGGR